MHFWILLFFSHARQLHPTAAIPLVGLVLRVISEPVHALRPDLGWGWLVALSAVLQWLAGMAFVLNTWARIKEK